MEQVAGLGGFFFRAKDPERLKEWYDRNLGVRKTPASYDAPCWQQDAGPTVFEPFPLDTDYFGSPAIVWMINFRVRDLDSMVGQLRAAGIAVEVDPQEYPNGRFARLNDPEGNPIAIWQPQGGDTPRAVGRDAGMP